MKVEIMPEVTWFWDGGFRREGSLQACDGLAILHPAPDIIWIGIFNSDAVAAEFGQYPPSVYQIKDGGECHIVGCDTLNHEAMLANLRNIVGRVNDLDTR